MNTRQRLTTTAALILTLGSNAALAGASPWPTTPKLPSAPSAVPTLPVAPSSSTGATPPPPVLNLYGRSERVRIGDSPAIQIVARLDDAVKTSSLYASSTSYFTKDGDLWVSFVIDNGSVLPGNRTAIQRKVLKDQRVRARGGGIGHQPLVAVDICVGNTTLPLYVTLLPRSGYTAPLRIGHDDIARIGGVDPTREFTTEPGCVAPEPDKQATAPER